MFQWLKNRNPGGEVVFEGKYFPEFGNYNALLKSIFPLLLDFKLYEGQLGHLYDNLLLSETSSSCHIKFDENDITSLTIEYELENTLSLTLVFSRDCSFSHQLMEKAVLLDGGLAYAYYYEFDYVVWQNADRYNSYKYKDGLSTYKRNGERYVDISNRPGRKEILDGRINFKFLGASIFWFGSRYSEHWEWDYLLRYRGALKRELVNSEVVKYQLYSIYEGDASEAQMAQWEFRNFLKVDSIAEDINRKIQDQWNTEYQLKKFQKDLRAYQSSESIKIEKGDWPANWIYLAANNVQQVLTALGVSDCDKTEASFDKGLLATAFSQATFVFKIKDGHFCIFGWEHLVDEQTFLESIFIKRLAFEVNNVTIFYQMKGLVYYVDYKNGQPYKKLIIEDYDVTESKGIGGTIDQEFIHWINSGRLNRKNSQDLASVLLLDKEHLFQYFLFCCLNLKHWSLLEPIQAGLLIRKPTVLKPWWKFW